MTYGFAGFCAITFGMFLHHYVENHIITQTLRAINNALRSVPDLPNRLAVALTEDAIFYRDLVRKIFEEFSKLIS